MAWIFTFCLLLGPLAWLGLIVLAIFGRHRMSRLNRNRAPLPDPPPTLSIVVPAKDEAAGIAGCVSRVLGQDYPGAEVVVIDDRSTDGTSQILDELAAAEPRLRPFHVTDLPAGWLGKCHALFVGTRGLKSDWLLLVDSDVQLSPDAARLAVAMCAAREYDVLSIMPTLDARSFWERSLLPLMAMAWSAAFRISFTNDDSRPAHAFANGQFFLIRRDWYERVNGHESVRDQIVEDVALMRVLKRAGAKTRLMLGQDLARARMHTDFRQMYHGWARIFAGSSGRSVRPMVSVMLFMIGTIAVLGIETTCAIHTRDVFWIGAAAAHVTTMIVLLAWTYRTAGQSMLLVLALPVSWPIVLSMLGYAIYVCGTGKVVWRGTNVRVNQRLAGADPIAQEESNKTKEPA